MSHNTKGNRESNVELRPAQYLDVKSPTGSDNGHVALIVLNSPIEDLQYLRRLYDHASFRLCADGGANRLYDALTSQMSNQTYDVALKNMLPDLIHGDLDSLRDDVRKRYEPLNVPISQDPDQYSTDFGKGIHQILQLRPSTREVLIFGSLGGRVDQGIGLLHELYREQMHRHPNVRFWLFTEISITVLLQKGRTVVDTPLNQGLLKRSCGILPLYGPAVISTEGLEWDVKEWRTELGGQVSTSNHVVAKKVVVETDREVLFTIERAVDR